MPENVSCLPLCCRSRPKCALSCDPLLQGSKAVAHFMRDNWKNLTAYLIVWGVIVVLVGRLHGFEHTGKALTIGLAAGIGGGALSAVVVVQLHPPPHRQEGKYKTLPKSAWEFIRDNLLVKLDIGTKALFISIVVSLIIELIPHFPHGVGTVIGVMMGNHLMTQLRLNSKTWKEAREQNGIEEQASDEVTMKSLKRRVMQLERIVKTPKYKKAKFRKKARFRKKAGGVVSILAKFRKKAGGVSVVV